VRMLRKKAKGWSINVEYNLRKQKKEISEEYNRLDILEETQALNSSVRDRKQQLARELNKMWEMEEIKARQRAREKILKRGIEILSIFTLWLIKEKQQFMILKALMGLSPELKISLRWQHNTIRNCLNLNLDPI
jgi:superfamily II RNA helicase